ncbi:hypothetical protein JCM3765_004253 [Sporobolomyces pararoseus]
METQDDDNDNDNNDNDNSNKASTTSKRPCTSPSPAQPSSNPTSSSSSHLSDRPSFSPSISTLLERRQPRQALLNTFIQGESALSPLFLLVQNKNRNFLERLELESLSNQLETNCSSSSPSSSCFFFPSSPPTPTPRQFDPTPEEASRALSVYFSELEPSFNLYPTNSSRSYLSSRIEKYWNPQGQVVEDLEGKALFLATVASSAVVSNDLEWIEKGKLLLNLASQIVLRDLRFASNPTVNSLRTLLIILYTSLLGLNQSSSSSSLLNLEEILGFFPIFIKAGFKLELNLDLIDLNTLSINTVITTGVKEEDDDDEVEERRVIWYQLLKIETIWSTLLQTPMIDLSSNSTTRLPRHLDPTQSYSLSTTTTSTNTTETILETVSKLSQTIFSSNKCLPRPPELKNLLQTLLDSQIIETNTIGSKALIGFAVLRLQNFLQETGLMESFEGSVGLNDHDWLIQVECDMLDRLPSLLLILQGATLVALRLSSLSTSQLELRFSITTQLNHLTNTLRTTPWPSHMHLFVKRGVIVLEHLSLKINESIFLEPDSGIPPPPPPFPSPSLCTSPSSSRSSH